LRKSGNSQLVEQAVRQRLVERHRGVVPPAPAVGRNPSGRVGRHAAGYQLAVDDLAVLSVLELHRPQATAHPTIDVGKDAGCFRKAEVALPPCQILPERFAYLRETAPGATPGQLAHALLHAFDGLARHPPPDRPSLAAHFCSRINLGEKVVFDGDGDPLHPIIVTSASMTFLLQRHTRLVSVRRVGWMCWLV